MTNREYLEDHNIAFNKAMAEFNASGLESFDKWLNEEHIDWKFKVGDFLTDVNYCTVGVIVDMDDKYLYAKFLKQDGTFEHWSSNCVKDCKYPDNHEIFVISKDTQCRYQKIF